LRVAVALTRAGRRRPRAPGSYLVWATWGWPVKRAWSRLAGHRRALQHNKKKPHKTIQSLSYKIDYHSPLPELYLLHLLSLSKTGNPQLSKLRNFATLSYFLKSS
jgi:hypothetical protein